MVNSISIDKLNTLYKKERLSVDQWTIFINNKLKRHALYKNKGKCFLDGSITSEIWDYCDGDLKFCANLGKSLEIFKKNGFKVKVIKPSEARIKCRPSPWDKKGIEIWW